MAEFIWFAGGESVIQPFEKICGLTIGGKRPNAVVFTSEDMGVLLGRNPECAKRWLSSVHAALAGVSNG